MLRDVLVASINKGQFPIAVVSLIAMSLIWRMPQSDVGTLVFRIIDDLEDGSLFGYLLAGALAGGWFVHARYQRRVITSEIDRVSQERDHLQRKGGAAVRSSEAHK